jgi:hypothetical protein
MPTFTINSNNILKVGTYSMTLTGTLTGYAIISSYIVTVNVNSGCLTTAITAPGIT